MNKKTSRLRTRIVASQPQVVIKKLRLRGLLCDTGSQQHRSSARQPNAQNINRGGAALWNRLLVTIARIATTSMIVISKRCRSYAADHRDREPELFGLAHIRVPLFTDVDPKQGNVGGISQSRRTVHI